MQILLGDCLEVLQTLPDHSIQCCVTSPPYFGLRDYGTAEWFDGNPECDHRMPRSTSRHRLGDKSTANAGSDPITWWRCGKCGAQRIDHQIGLEATPDGYVSKLVAVFREVKRVLRDDGTVWLVLGDSYASKWPCQRRSQMDAGSLPNGKREARPPRVGPGLKDKDLIGIPWKVAFGLQTEGWYIRSDIIWHKPNPMPESVKDRPTNAYEHLFLLTKRARYYFDPGAIATPSVRSNDERGRGPGRKRMPADGGDQRPNGMRHAGIYPLANARNVWTITTEASKVPHFATMPVELAEHCILAGSRVGDTVLDPFGGTGTTALAALKHARDAILIELNAEYVQIAERRVNASSVGSSIIFSADTDLVGLRHSHPSRSRSRTDFEAQATRTSSRSSSHGS